MHESQGNVSGAPAADDAITENTTPIRRLSFIIPHGWLLVVALVCGLAGCAGQIETQARHEKDFANSLGMKMICTSEGYWISQCETRQGGFEKVMGYNPSHFRGPNRPVESLTRDQAMEFCDKLSVLEKQAGRLPEGYVYTLPTEHQWFQCQAHASYGNAVSRFRPGPPPASTADVGTGEPNKLGLYDMQGNVMEMLADAARYEEHQNASMCGESWRSTTGVNWSAGVSTRTQSAIESRDDAGFRYVLTPHDKNRLFEMEPAERLAYWPLWRAVYATDIAAARRALAGGAGVNRHDPWGESPLHRAVWTKDTAMMDLLMTHGADVNNRQGITGGPVPDGISPLDEGRTALFDAVIAEGNAWSALRVREMVILLLDHGANVNVGDLGGTTPLHKASYDPDIVKRLLERGANVNSRDSCMQTPLENAVTSEHPEVVRILIEAGADVNARDVWGDTVLDRVRDHEQVSGAYAAEQAQIKQMLLDHGATGRGWFLRLMRHF